MVLETFTLEQLGWNNRWAEQFAPYAPQGHSAGRVAIAHRGSYTVYTAAGDLTAEVSGRLRYHSRGAEDLPAVGDWVALRPRLGEARAVIHAVLPRQTKLSRKVAGEHLAEQVMAANVDVVFLVTALNQDFNLRRLERYLTLAWSSGATPVVLLTKADLCEAAELVERIAEVEASAPGAAIEAISSRTGYGLDRLAAYFAAGQTGALLGSSGVGKSTLINRLLGRDALRTREVRDDGRGRHTTTHRELLLLPAGGLIIDTPGMRELQLWDDEESGGQGLNETFEDIEQLAQQCLFNDCQHEREPRCAVRRALEEGTLAAERFASYQKLQRELHHLEVKQDQRLRAAENKKWKAIHKEMRHFTKG